MAKRHRAERCDWWPDCNCKRRWLWWQDGAIARLPDEYVREAWEDIRMTLECVSQFCPNKRLRRAATVQLLNPIWRRLPAELEDDSPCPELEEDA